MTTVERPDLSSIVDHTEATVGVSNVVDFWGMSESITPSLPQTAARGKDQRRIVTLVAAGLSVAVALGIAAMFIRLIPKFSVDVPFYDDWVTANLLDKQDRGTLAWADFWKSNNEHRVPVPLLAMLVVSRVTRMNLRVQMGVSLATLLGTCSFIMWTARKFARTIGVSAIACYCLIATFVLTRAQWNNVLWGWQMTLTFGAFFGMATLFLLAPVDTTKAISWKRWCSAVSVALLCQYSFASGILIWPIGFVLLVLRVGHHRWQKLAGWSTIGVLSIFLYIQGIGRAGGTGGADPIHTVDYSLTQLGAPFAVRVWECANKVRCQPIHREPLLAGSIGVALLMLTFVFIWRLKLLTQTSAILAWGTWAIASALLTAIGRASLGTDQALASRYVTLTTPLWASLAILIPIIIQKNLTLAKFAAHKLVLVLTVISVTFSVSMTRRMGNWEQAAAGYEAGLLFSRGSLRNAAATDDQLRPLFIDVKEIRRLLPTMERQRISVYRDTKPVTP